MERGEGEGGEEGGGGEGGGGRGGERDAVFDHIMGSKRGQKDGCLNLKRGFCRAKHHQLRPNKIIPLFPVTLVCRIG